MGFIDSVDTMILGANTYAQSKDGWPYAEEQGEYGEKLNNLTKFVVSSRGKGTRIFEDRRDLQPLEATGFEYGIVLLRYEIK